MRPRGEGSISSIEPAFLSNTEYGAQYTVLHCVECTVYTVMPGRCRPASQCSDGFEQCCCCSSSLLYQKEGNPRELESVVTITWDGLKTQDSSIIKVKVESFASSVDSCRSNISPPPLPPPDSTRLDRGAILFHSFEENMNFRCGQVLLLPLLLVDVDGFATALTIRQQRALPSSINTVRASFARTERAKETIQGVDIILRAPSLFS